MRRQMADFEVRMRTASWLV